jgi:fructokinase
MRIGIDLGGSKIEGVVLGPAGVERARLRIPAPQGSYLATLDALCGLVAQLEARAGVSPEDRIPVGIGIPGALSRLTGRIKNANSIWLIGEALDHDLSARLERPIRVENDANCMAISEAADGAAAGADPVFGVILGTGVGGAIVAGGRIIRGAMAISGEWGHNPLPVSDDPVFHELEWPGPACYCGRRGCIETWLSGPGLVADHRRANRSSSLSAVRLVELARSGDRAATASLDRWLDRLARALASVINILDPEVIVVGGGLSQIEALYREVPQRWGRHVFSDRVDTRIVPARHGDASGVRGAAWLWDKPAHPG